MSEKMKKVILAFGILIGMGILFYVWFYLSLVKLTVNSNPTGASVYVDNTVFTSPGSARLKPGTYKIWVLKTGYYPYEKQITVRRWEKNYLNVVIQINNEESKTVISGDDAVIKKPAINDLPYTDNDHFGVSWDEEEQKYLISPNIEIDSPTFSQEEMMNNNWSLYVQYAHEALAWMKSKGVTPTKDNIEWWAQEYWPDGKSISIN